MATERGPGHHGGPFGTVTIRTAEVSGPRGWRSALGGMGRRLLLLPGCRSPRSSSGCCSSDPARRSCGRCGPVGREFPGPSSPTVSWLRSRGPSARGPSPSTRPNAPAPPGSRRGPWPADRSAARPRAVPGGRPGSVVTPSGRGAQRARVRFTWCGSGSGGSPTTYISRVVNADPSPSSRLRPVGPHPFDLQYGHHDWSRCLGRSPFLAGGEDVRARFPSVSTRARTRGCLARPATEE